MKYILIIFLPVVIFTQQESVTTIDSWDSLANLDLNLLSEEEIENYNVELSGYVIRFNKESTIFYLLKEGAKGESPCGGPKGYEFLELRDLSINQLQNYEAKKVKIVGKFEFSDKPKEYGIEILLSGSTIELLE